MAKTRFSLGYEYNNKLTPLSVFVSGDELVGSELTDVIKFTSSFNNENQLRDYLKKSKGTGNIPENANLVYLKEPKNPAYGPSKVLGLDHICYSSSTSLLEPDVQLEYFLDNRYDIDLIEKLYVVLISSLSNVTQVESFYTNEELANDSNAKFISIFKKNKSRVINGNNYLFLFMDEVYSESVAANERGIENYENDYDRKDLKYLIKRLYDSITIIKDKKGHFKYNQNNGKIERYSRILGYFAILISKDMKDKFDEYSEAYKREMEEEAYEEFLQEMMKLQDTQPDKSDLVNYRYDNPNDEEFLTSEDFDSKGLDPEENGYNYR